uniref:Nudix hydrolase domain-containing protein n=1 Tax=viral metagenome TaxID=1070528 RepID=A0A6C0BTV9_9ZZZZ
MNLGGRKPNILAKDDADLVHAIRTDDITNGKYAMPFCHVYFLMEYYRKIGRDDYVKKFEVLFDLSRIRNRRIMRKVNTILDKHEGKKLFDLNKMTPIDIDRVKTYAKVFGIDTSQYLRNEKDEEDDVSQCTSQWCLDQSLTPGKASDSVQLITDLDNVDWLILITRKNGPGRNDKALAGGFVDPGETFVEAADREKNEETEVELFGTYTTTVTDLDNVMIMDWDPRAKFPHGMNVFARVTHHVFRNN